MDGHDVSVNRGRQELSAMIDFFGIKPPVETLEAAVRIYRLAVQRGFTRGRSVQRVAASCLYIWCRCARACVCGAGGGGRRLAGRRSCAASPSLSPLHTFTPHLPHFPVHS